MIGENISRMEGKNIQDVRGEEIGWQEQRDALQYIMGDQENLRIESRKAR